MEKESNRDIEPLFVPELVEHVRYYLFLIGLGDCEFEEAGEYYFENIAGKYSDLQISTAFYANGK